jgi:hypothetical protein
MYKTESGLKVFYLDALDIRQNECALLIQPAPKQATGASSESVEERLRNVEELKTTGLISAEDAQKKRQEILSGL